MIRATMAKNLYENLPDTPGVYMMRGKKGELLYIGKAGNLRRRVASYFLRPHDARIEKLVENIKKIDYRETDTALDALILEAALIKRFLPPFNIREKDDTSFLFIEITRDAFPRVLLVRGRVPQGGRRFGPFTSAASVREALRIMRKIFPWSVHAPEMLGKYKRPCFDYEIGLCPGTCVGKADKNEYRKNIANFVKFLSGKKQTIIRILEREMQGASKKTEFEKAAKIRKQLFALQHIEDVSLIGDESRNADNELGKGKGMRIEGYDISNISGTSAVGSMVVFQNGKPDKNEYRKFKIRTVGQPDDTGMLREMLSRRLAHREWALPDAIFVDGGKGQVNAVLGALAEAGLKIPVVGIAKGPTRKNVEVIGSIPEGVSKAMLLRIRDEAHRFAISYHRSIRGKMFLI